MSLQTIKRILLTGTALVAMNVAAQAQTVTLNGGNATVSADPAATPAITFTTNHVATVNDNVNITGTVTAGTTNFGTLTFSGTSTVSAAVGVNAGNVISVINAGVASEIVTFSSTVDATNFSVSGTGTVNFNGNVGAAVNYTANGTINVAASRGITGAITTTGAGTGGTLVFAGAGSYSSTLATSGNRLTAITLSGTGTTVTGGGNTFLAGTNTLGNNLLNITSGTVNLAASQTLVTTIGTASGTGHGRIASSGNATVAAGALVTINVAATTYIGGTNFTLINGTGGTNVAGLTGAGAGTGTSLGNTDGITDNSSLYTFTQVGAATEDLVVTATRVANTTISNGSNNSAVADTLFATALTTSVNTQVVNLQAALANATTNAAVNNLWESVSPTVDGGAVVASLDSVATVQGFGETRLAALRNGDVGTGWAAGSPTDGMGAWFQVYGQTATQDARGGVDGYDSDTYGGAIGFDSATVLDGTTVGLALNYGATEVDSNNANRTATDIDSYGVTLYAERDLGDRSFLNAQVGYAYNKIDSNRYDVGAPGTTANADYNSDQYSAKVLVGRDYAGYDGLTLTPTVYAAYTLVSTDNYTETGAGGLNLTSDTDNISGLDLGVGVKASADVDAGGGARIKPSVHIGYAYDAISDRLQTTSSFSVGPSFETEGIDPARSTLNAGAGVTFATADNWDLTANYDYQFKSDYDSHNGLIRASTSF